MFSHSQQLSQFWYNEKTKEHLASVCRQCKIASGNSINFRVALLSCPSLYESIKAANADGTVHIFEYDKRFAAYGSDFVHYDYNKGSSADYMQEFSNSFDLVIADPPFLSEECIEKIGNIIKNIAKSNGRIVLCSGMVVADWATKYIHLKKCEFEPQHERNLGNEFVSYANFELDEFIKNVS